MPGADPAGPLGRAPSGCALGAWPAAALGRHEALLELRGGAGHLESAGFLKLEVEEFGFINLHMFTFIFILCLSLCLR